MPRSKNFLAAGFLLVVLAIFAIWQPEDSTLVEPLEADSTIPSQVEDLPRQAAPIANEYEGVRSKDVSVAQPVEASAKAKLPIQPRYEGDGGAVITAIDARSEQPVPLADVYLLSSDEFRRVRNDYRLDSDERHMASILHKLGKRYQTDEAGHAYIPPPDKYLFMVAETDELIGVEGGLEPGMKEYAITVRPIYPLIAQVIDADGNPVAGVPVAIQYTYYSSTYVGPTRRTDTEGKAHFTSIGMLHQKNGGPTKFFARVEVPVKRIAGMDPEQIELTDSVLEKGEITLTLPATGGVRIRVIEESGKPVSTPGTVAIHTKDWKSGTPTDQRLEKEVADGMVEFPFIGLGTTLTASFEQIEGRNKDHITVNGPQQAGEWIEVELPATNWPFITGVLLDHKGNAVVNQKCDLKAFRTMGERERSAQYRVNTDQDGRFQTEMGGADEAQFITARRGVFTAKLPEAGASRAEFIIPHPLMPGKNDVGEVLLSSVEARLSADYVKALAGVTTSDLKPTDTSWMEDSFQDDDDA